MEDKNQEEEEISRHERKGDSSVQDLDKCQAVASVRFMTRFKLLVFKEAGPILYEDPVRVLTFPGFDVFTLRILGVVSRS